MNGRSTLKYQPQLKSLVYLSDASRSISYHDTFAVADGLVPNRHQAICNTHAPCSAIRDYDSSHNSYNVTYGKTSNISRTLVGNKIVDNSDVVGAPPVGTAPTTSSLST